MGLQITESVDLAQAPDAVWSRFCEVERWPEWFPMLRAVRRVARGPFTVREPIVLTLAMAGRETRVTVRVTEARERHVRWRGTSFGVTGDHAFFVEATERGSRFTSDETFSGIPLLVVPKRYFATVQQEVAAGLDRFVTLCT